MSNSHWKPLERQSFEIEITWTFWEATLRLTWWDEASQSYVLICQVESWFAFHICGENYDFKIVKIYIWCNCIELCVECTLTVVLDTCWVRVSALQHGLVSNHHLAKSKTWLSDIYLLWKADVIKQNETEVSNSHVPSVRSFISFRYI